MTPDEAAAVLRRAAELQAASDLQSDEVLDTAAVVQLGSELGLTEQAVRTALAERTSSARVPSSVAPPAVLGLDASVVVERVLPLGPDAVQAHLSAWLRRQLMQRLRTEPGRSTWRAQRGLAADLRRGVDVFGTLELKGVTAVELRTEPDPDGTRVVVALALTGARTEALVGLVALPAGVVGGVALLAGAIVSPEALLGLPLAGAAGGAGWLGARAAVGARKRSVVAAVDVALDEVTGS